MYCVLFFFQLMNIFTKCYQWKNSSWSCQQPWNEKPCYCFPWTSGIYQEKLCPEFEWAKKRKKNKAWRLKNKNRNIKVKSQKCGLTQRCFLKTYVFTGFLVSLAAYIFFFCWVAWRSATASAVDFMEGVHMCSALEGAVQVEPSPVDGALSLA